VILGTIVKAGMIFLKHWGTFYKNHITKREREHDQGRSTFQLGGDDKTQKSLSM
jgi:hypothetical protein